MLAFNSVNEGRDSVVSKNILSIKDSVLEQVIKNTKQVVITPSQIEESQDKDFECIFEKIYIGSRYAYYEVLEKKSSIDFANVISVCPPVYLQRLLPQNHLVVDIDDCEEDLGCFQELFPAIRLVLDKAREQDASVLVHCYQGVSRSVTAILFYLIQRLDVSFEEALNFVQSKRAAADPIPAFRQMLEVASKRKRTPLHG